MSRVFGYDGENPADVLAMIASFAALHISNIPFECALGAIRVGMIDDKLVSMPTDLQKRSESALDLVVSGHEQAIVMVEASAQELPESDVIDALEFAHEEVRKIVALVDELRRKVGKEKLPFVPPEADPELERRVEAFPLRDEGRDHHRGQGRPVRGGLQGQGGMRRGLRRALPRRQGQAEGGQDPGRQPHRQPGAGADPRGTPRGRTRQRRDPRDHDRAELHPSPSRLGAVHAGRDPGDRVLHPGHSRRRADHRRDRGGVQEVLLPALQLPALQRGRDAPHHGAGPAGDRARHARRASHRRGPALQGRLPLHPARRLGDPRVQRLLLHGHGLRGLPGLDAGRGPAHPAGGRYRHGPHPGGGQDRDPLRHPGLGGPQRRHGLQGGRIGPWDHRPPDGHQDHRRDPCPPGGCPDPGARRSGLDPAQDAGRGGPPELRDLRVRPAHGAPPGPRGPHRLPDRSRAARPSRACRSSTSPRSPSRTTATSASPVSTVPWSTPASRPFRPCARPPRWAPVTGAR